MKALKEYNLSTDDFYQPKVSRGREAVGILIVRLLLLEPGTDPMRPEMGVGLVSKYRYMFPEKLGELKKNIADQLTKYLVPYQTVGIILSTKDNCLIIEIKLDDMVYKYVTVEQEDNKITLTELFEGDK